MDIELAHKYFKTRISSVLVTDQTGSVKLGHLEDIEKVTVKVNQGLHLAFTYHEFFINQSNEIEYLTVLRKFANQEFEIPLY